MFTSKETLNHLKRSMGNIGKTISPLLRESAEKINQCDGLYFALAGADFTSERRRFYIGMLVSKDGMETFSDIYSELLDLSCSPKNIIFSVQRKDVAFELKALPVYNSQMDVFFIACDISMHTPSVYSTPDMTVFLTQVLQAVTLACSKEQESKELAGVMQKMRGG